MLSGISRNTAFMPQGTYFNHAPLFSLQTLLKVGIIATLFTKASGEFLAPPLSNASFCKLSDMPIEDALRDKAYIDLASDNSAVAKWSSEFSGVEPGDFVFFAHVTKLTHLAISTFQQSNITHVGIVTDVRKDQGQISIAEIPAHGKSTTVTTYHLKDLHDDEELLFTSPSRAPEVKNSLAKFSNHFLSLSDIPENLNQYDLQGLLQIPTTCPKLDDKAKKNLIHSLIEYFIYEREPHTITEGSIEPKKYFCSSLVSQLYQLSQIAKNMPEHLLQSFKQLKAENLDDPSVRSSVVDSIHAMWSHSKFWDMFNNDPLFQISSAASTPKVLYDLTKETGGKNLIVRNLQAQKKFDSSNLTDEQALDFLEYQVTKLLSRVANQETITVEDPEVLEIVKLLEHNFGYSKESLNCFLQECTKSSEPAPCIEKCLEKTLTLKEKLHIFLISRQINRITDELLHKPEFLEFVHEPNIDKIKQLKTLKIEQLIEDRWDIALPTNALSLTSLENVVAKHAFQHLTTKSLVKYVPLSIAYFPPTNTIKEFLKEEEISLVELAEMALLMKQLREGNVQSNQMNQVLKLADHFGINNGAKNQFKELLKPSLEVTSQKT